MSYDVAKVTAAATGSSTHRGLDSGVSMPGPPDTHLEDLLIDDVEAGQKAETLVLFDEDVDGSLYLGHPPLNLSDFVGEKCLFALEFQDVIPGGAIQGDDHGQSGDCDNEARAERGQIMQCATRDAVLASPVIVVPHTHEGPPLIRHSDPWARGGS